MASLDAETTLEYTVDGPETGTPIVLLHPFGADRSAWDAHVEELDGGPIVRPDLRGHGETGVVGDGSTEYTLDLFAADSHELVSGVTGAPLLVGCSLGAATALTYALEHPGSVSGVVASGVAERKLHREVLVQTFSRVQSGLISLFGYSRVSDRLGLPPQPAYERLTDLLDDPDDELDTTETVRRLTEADVDVTLVRGPGERPFSDELRASGADVAVLSSGGHIAPLRFPEECCSLITARLD